MRERREAGDAGAVEFVASRLGPEGPGAFQEWRYRSTGRVIEVAEANAFAPSVELNEGETGFVRYERGIPVVVPRPGARLGRPVTVVRGRSARTFRVGGTAVDPRRDSPWGRLRFGSAVWWLAGLLILVIVLVWGR